MMMMMMSNLGLSLLLLLVSRLLFFVSIQFGLCDRQKSTIYSNSVKCNTIYLSSFAVSLSTMYCVAQFSFTLSVRFIIATTTQDQMDRVSLSWIDGTCLPVLVHSNPEEGTSPMVVQKRFHCVHCGVSHATGG